MPTPTGTQIHDDGPLTDYSHALMQDDTKFSARKVFGTTPTAKQSDKFYVYDLGSFHTTRARNRAPSSVAPTIGYRLSKSTFFCDVKHVRAGTDDQDRANADPIINLEMDNTELVMNDLLIRQETDWLATFFATGGWDTDTAIAAGDRWENAGSTPIETIRSNMDTIEVNSGGLRGNTAVVGANVHRRLIDHPDIVIMGWDEID